MTPAEVRVAMPSLEGKNVAVIFKGRGLTIWGKLLPSNSDRFHFILKSFKTGDIFMMIPQSVDFITELLCEPEEIQY